MSFPASPVNNQISTVNGIAYIYSTANRTWTATTAQLVTSANVTVANVTPASSTNTGAAVVTGGIGVGGNIYIGGTLYSGSRTFGIQSTASTTPPTNPQVGDIWYNTTTDVAYRWTTDGVTAVWVDATGPTLVDTGGGTSFGNVSVVSNTNSTSTSSGALLVNGGAGVSGNLYVGGNIAVIGNTVPTGPGVIMAIPAWTSAGTLTVGATTTAPTKGTTLFDNLSYRQIGALQWEILITYIQTAVSANAGSGDYLITLPNNLKFNTTLATQQIYTGSIDTNTYATGSYIIPNSFGLITNSPNGSATGGNIYPVIWNATQFRLYITAYYVGAKCWGSNFYSTADYAKIQTTFKFTSL